MWIFHSLDRIGIILLVILSAVILPSCANPPSPTPTPPQSQEIDSVQVSLTQPVLSSSGIEKVDLDNCSGSAELTQTISSESSVSKRVSITDVYSLSGEIKVSVPLVIEGKLTAEIEKAYQQEFENEVKKSFQVKMSAAPETHIVYEVNWVDQVYSSELTFNLNGDPHRATYQYVVTTPKPDKNYRIQCPTRLEDEVSQGGSVLFEDNFDRENWSTNNAWECSQNCGFDNVRLKDDYLYFSVNGDSTNFITTGEWSSQDIASLETLIYIEGNDEGSMIFSFNAIGCKLEGDTNNQWFGCGVGDDQEYVSKRVWLSTGEWHRVIIYFDKATTQARFTMDGEEIGAYSYAKIPSYLTLFIGVWSPGLYNVRFDDIRITGY